MSRDTGSPQSSRAASRDKDYTEQNSSAASGKERFHAGASKWGKYKKKEKEAKKRKTRK